MCKVLCMSDTHYPFSPEVWRDKIEQCDMIVHAGDLGMWGDLQEWPSRLDSLQKLASYGKPVYFCPGNHDTGFASEQAYMYYEDLNKSGIHSGLELFDTPAGKLVMLPWVTDLPGWAFNRTEEEIGDYLDNVLGNPLSEVDVIVSHAPVQGMLDWAGAEHPSAGCSAYRDLFAKLRATGRPPKLWVCGHIHESYGEKCIGGTKFVNASHCDAWYAQVNEPILVEI